MTGSRPRSPRAPASARWAVYWRLARRQDRPSELATLGLSPGHWLAVWLVATAWWHPWHALGLMTGAVIAVTAGSPLWGPVGWAAWWAVAGPLAFRRLHRWAGPLRDLRDPRVVLKSLLRLHRLRTRWPAAATAVEMIVPGTGEPLRLSRLRRSPLGISATVAPGAAAKTAMDLAAASGGLAAVIGCRVVTVRQGVHPGLATVEFTWEDALVKPRPLAALPAAPRGQIAFGVTEHGEPATVSAGLSVLGVGASGSGKSTLAWAMLESLLRSKTPFRLRVLDPKGGMELGALRGRAHAYGDTPAEIVHLIESTVAMAQTRQRRKKGRGERGHTPTPEEPLEIVLVDELLAMRALLDDGQRARWRDGLRLLLAMGRATGHVVWGFSQLGHIDSLGRDRDLFPQRLCLRTTAPDVTDAVLGQGATTSGALAHTISPRTPGIGYMQVDARPGYTRFRTVHVLDADVPRITGEIYAVKETGHLREFRV